MSKASRMLPALLLLLTVAGCGLDFSVPSKSEPVLLSGTWNGAMEDDGPALRTISMVFNSSGNISQVWIDGGITPLTATVSGVTGSSVFFSFLLSPVGKQGGLLTDSSFRHAGFVYEGAAPNTLVAGVLEKDGSTGVSYDITNIIDSNWNGSNLVLDANLNYVSSVSSTAIVGTLSDITGYKGANIDFTGTLGFATVGDENFGFYSGSYSKPAPETGLLGVFLSPDKTFAGSYACTDGTRNTSKCNYYTWKRQ
jgi:hypothetical protein